MTAKTIITITKELKERKDDLAGMERDARIEYEDERNKIYNADENQSLPDSEVEKKCRALYAYEVWHAIHQELQDICYALDDFTSHSWH